MRPSHRRSGPDGSPKLSPEVAGRRSGWVAAFLVGWPLSIVAGAAAQGLVVASSSEAGLASGAAAAGVLEGTHVSVAEVLPLTALLVSMVPMWAVQFGAAAAAVVGPRHRWRTDLGLRLRPVDLLWGLVGGVGAQVAISAVYALARIDAGGPARLLVDKGGGWLGSLVLVVALALVAPVVEEVFFRGLFQGGLLARWTPRSALLMSSVVFAFAHLQPVQFPGLFVAGLVFGGLALRHGRLGPAIAAHVFFNLSTVLVLLAG